MLRNKEQKLDFFSILSELFRSQSFRVTSHTSSHSSTLLYPHITPFCAQIKAQKTTQATSNFTFNSVLIKIYNYSGPEINFNLIKLRKKPTIDMKRRHKRGTERKKNKKRRKEFGWHSSRYFTRGLFIN